MSLPVEQLARAGDARGPMSPCISVCVLNAAGYCNGCWRTGDEIGGWMSMSAAEQWALLRRLDARRLAAATVSA